MKDRKALMLLGGIVVSMLAISERVLEGLGQF
jgi:hypothetical protein